jgi:hypothetical protein
VNAGGTIYPLSPYNARFANAQDPHVARLFVQMHRSCSALHQSSTNGIDLERFCNGWSFFVQSLTASGEDTDGFELLREGVTTVRLEFNVPLPQAVELLVLGEFDNLLEIDRHRVVMSNAPV